MVRQETAGLGLQQSDQVAHLDEKLALGAFLGREGAFVALAGKFFPSDVAPTRPDGGRESRGPRPA